MNGQLGFDLDAALPAGDDLPPAACAGQQLTWWGFSVDHGEQAAISDFRRRFGVDPAGTAAGAGVPARGSAAWTCEFYPRRWTW